MKKYFTVGEFSELFGLNVQTLHYYDSIGIFQPVNRDERTGRRQYGFDQVYKLASIRYLRRLGYSLEDVAVYMDSRQTDTTLDVLKKRSVELRQQLEELLGIDEAIQRKIRYIEKAQREMGDLSAVTVRSFGQRYYIPLGSEELLFFHDSFYFYPTIAFYRGAEKYFGAYLFEEGASPQERASAVQQTELILPGEYLCGYHQGPYDTVEKTAQRIRSCRPDLILSDLTMDFNIIDQFVEKDSQNYITNLQIRIQ